MLLCRLLVDRSYFFKSSFPNKSCKYQQMLVWLHSAQAHPCRDEDWLLLALALHTSQKDLDKLLYCSVSLYFWVSIHIVLDTYKYKFLVTVLFVSLPLPSFLGLAFW